MGTNGKKVYVGLSGGVDSSVSAALLKEQGYDVTGVYMKNWTRDVAGVACPWRVDLADARAAAAVLDIPFKVFDFQDAYRQNVVDAMVAEYVAGRTPNPDVMCNSEIKFKLFLQSALADGADLVATGHYARVEDGRLLRAVDNDKDQTYFLYRVTPEALSRTLFPIGGLTKPEVRVLAARFDLPTATKPDSQGICFVGEVGIRPFIREYVSAAAGPVIEQATGKRVGTHEGALFYTVGQRHGLGTGGGQTYYVTGKSMHDNTVFVTTDPADTQLTSDTFILSDCNWILLAPVDGCQVEVRIRHRGRLNPGTVEVATNGSIGIRLRQPERAVAAGQSAVLYRDGAVLGGGIIAAVKTT